MPCKLCGAGNQGNFTAEINIHFSGLKNPDKARNLGIRRFWSASIALFGVYHTRKRIDAARVRCSDK